MNVIAGLFVLCNTHAQVLEVASFLDTGADIKVAIESANSNAKDASACGIAEVQVMVGNVVAVEKTNWGVAHVLVLPMGVEQYLLLQRKSKGAQI